MRLWYDGHEDWCGDARVFWLQENQSFSILTQVFHFQLSYTLSYYVRCLFSGGGGGGVLWANVPNRF